MRQTNTHEVTRESLSQMFSIGWFKAKARTRRGNYSRNQALRQHEYPVEIYY